MIRSVIIEDEYSSRELLKKFISRYATDIEVIGESESVRSGIEVLRQESPDLVFLDIELKDGHGFEVLRSVSTRSLSVVFITGYTRYAVEAIKHGALAYLLKPLLISDFRYAIDRVKEQISRRRLMDSVFNDQSDHVHNGRLISRDRKKILVHDLSDISYLRSEGNFTTLRNIQGSRATLKYNLTYYENTLPDSFFRVHKSFIVNLDQVEYYEHKRGGVLYLKHGASVPVSSRRKKEFLAHLEKHSERRI